MSRVGDALSTYLREDMKNDILGARRRGERTDVSVVLARVSPQLPCIEGPNSDLRFFIIAAFLLG